MKETMVALEHVDHGLYRHSHYSIEKMSGRWFVFDWDVMDWVADFATLRQVRSWLYKESSDSNN
jgi:hypothetical protein